MKQFKHVAIGQYADDTALWVRAKGAPRKTNYSKVNKKKAENKLKRLLEKPSDILIQNLEKHGFKINITKTQCLFFDTKEELSINIKGEKVNGLKKS